MGVRRWGRPRCASVVRRRPGRTVSALMLSAIAALAIGGIAQVDVSTDIGSFLPPGAASVAALQEHSEKFGGDPVVVLVESSEPDELMAPDTLPRLLGVEGSLSRLPDVEVVYGPATALNQVTAETQALLAQISGRRDALRVMAEQKAIEAGASTDEIAAAADRATDEFDLRYGGLIVRGLPAGLPTLRNAEFVDSVLYDENGAVRPQWRYLVPSRSAVAVLVRPRAGLDQSATEVLVDEVRETTAAAGLPAERVTVTGVPSITAALGAQVRREIPLLGAAAVLVVGMCFLTARWIGRPRGRLIPPLVALAATASVLAAAGWIGIPLSLGVVAFLPVLFGVAAYYPLYLMSRAYRRRVLVAAVASAASFASLAVSPLPFVRELGLALAAGVLLAVGIALFVLRTDPDAGPSPDVATAAPPARPLGRRVVLLTAALAVAAVGWAALPGLPVAADPQRLAAGLGAVQDAQRAEEVLGASGEVAVVLTGDDVLAPEALRWSRAAQDAVTLEFGSELRPIVSVADQLRFLGQDPTPQEITAAMQLVPRYLSAAVVDDSRHTSVISFGIRLQDIGSQAAILEGVRAELPPPPPGYRTDVVGLPVVAAEGYAVVSDGRYAGNVLGIVAAGAVLLIGLRRRMDALRAVGAAVLATGWGLALVQLTGQELSPLTVTLGSLTAAVGCEFTVVLASARSTSAPWLRRSVAMAAITAAIGFAVLVGSELAVLQQFGLFLAGSVLLSYLASRTVIRLLPPAAHVSAVGKERRAERYATIGAER